MGDEVAKNNAFLQNTTSTDSFQMTSKRPLKVQDYHHYATLDSIDSICTELKELHEKLLKMSVRAHMLEVDIATQFNPETLLEMRHMDVKCQKCMNATEDLQDRVDHLFADITEK